MIVEISWTDFHMRFLKTSEFVFVKENETEWVLYTNTSGSAIIIKSTVLKQEDEANNAAFVDRYLTSTTIVKLVVVNEELTLNVGLVRQ